MSASVVDLAFIRHPPDKLVPLGKPLILGTPRACGKLGARGGLAVAALPSK
jgi:hypothetical protein